MNTIYFKLEEEIKKKQQKYSKMDINMFDEIILGHMPPPYNYFEISKPNDMKQKGGNQYESYIDKYRAKLYTPLITDLFYNKIFNKTNYSKYKNKKLFDYIYDKFKIKTNNSVSIYNNQISVTKQEKEFMTEKTTSSIKLDKLYNLIIFTYNLTLDDTDYKTIIDSLTDIIHKNINDDGNLIIGLNILFSDDKLNETLFKLLITNFKNIHIYYLHDPLSLSIAPKIICINKQKNDNIFDQNNYELFVKKAYDAIEYNYNFIHNFLLYDDILQESIIYKIMSKF